MFTATINKKYAQLLLSAVLSLAVILVAGCSSSEKAKQPASNRSMDGKTKVVFSEWVSENGAIKSIINMVAVGDGGTRLVFKQDGQVDGLKVSPDHKKLAYFVAPDLLYAIRLDGSNRQMLDNATLGWANWSPDSKRLAYVKTIVEKAKGSKLRRKHNAIVINDLSEHHKTTLALGKYGLVTCAVLGWYPDGKQLAVFVSGTRETSSTLLRVDLRTKKVSAAAKNAVLKSFNPDGSLDIVRPVGLENPKGRPKVGEPKQRNSDIDTNISWEVWKLSKRNGLQQVVKERLPSSLVSWSSNSDRIVFSKADGTHSEQLFIANASGRAAKRITDLSSYENFVPVWSPDDASIVFSATKLTGKNRGTYFYYYDIKKGNVVPLLKGDETPRSICVLFAVFR